jgi:ribosomal protein L21
MQWLITASLLLLSPGDAVLTDTATVGRGIDTALECKKIKQKIRHIRSRMRSGYTRAQGERMEAELRRLRAMRRKSCR